MELAILRSLERRNSQLLTSDFKSFVQLFKWDVINLIHKLLFSNEIKLLDFKL